MQSHVCQCRGVEIDCIEVGRVWVVRVALQVSRARRSSMDVYCPVGEQHRHLVMLMGTSRGTTEVRYPDGLKLYRDWGQHALPDL